jgi:two-component system, cell cycle sensor histidine kinase and response regulator CckA
LLYQVLTASDGIEALALYAQHRAEISVVLVDMMMPAMDGVTTIRALQKINPSIEIIAISGLMTKEQITQIAAIGIEAFLSKPCTAKDLCGTKRELKRASSQWS